MVDPNTTRRDGHFKISSTNNGICLLEARNFPECHQVSYAERYPHQPPVTVSTSTFFCKVRSVAPRSQDMPLQRLLPKMPSRIRNLEHLSILRLVERQVFRRILC